MQSTKSPKKAPKKKKEDSDSEDGPPKTASISISQLHSYKDNQSVNRSVTGRIQQLTQSVKTDRQECCNVNAQEGLFYSLRQCHIVQLAITIIMVGPYVTPVYPPKTKAIHQLREWMKQHAPDVKQRTEVEKAYIIG